MDQPTKVVPTRLKFERGKFRVPNCALFDRNGTMTKFGSLARKRYNSLKGEDLKQSFFFAHVKMELQHDKNVSRETKVKAANGVEFFLVDVIAHILNWLKKKLLEVEARRELNATDFDWVITVPAIWKARGKQMMREAGYKAGLCTMQEPLPLCQAYKPQSIVEHNQDRLTLALEPECATAHCREAGGFREEENYILVDIGGGTVDIVSHAIVAGDLEEIIPPQGDDCGGTKINENFRDFLGCVLGDPKFFRFIGQHIPEDIRIRNERELDDLVYEEFEDHKCDFGTYYKSGQDNYNIKLRPYLWDCYKDVIKKKGEESISFDMAAHEMILSPSKMAELFEPTIRSIIAIVNKVLKEVGHIAENIYLAGGFGGSLYLKSKLEEALILQPMLYRFQLHPAPGESELGVVHGAVMFRCDPSLIHKRKSDNTYGIGVSVSFQQDVHDETKKFWNEDQQEYKCDDIFCTIVEKGDSISSESVYVKELNTGRKDTKLITIRIYSSPKKNVFYTTDDEVQRLGHFEVNVAGYGAYRKVEVAVDFTHCEIQLRAYDKQDPSNEVKLALDFLCNK